MVAVLGLLRKGEAGDSSPVFCCLLIPLRRVIFKNAEGERETYMVSYVHGNTYMVKFMLF